MTDSENKKGKGKKPNLALKDFHIFMPPNVDLHIKEGEDINKLNLPENLLMNLKTEKVMRG